MTTQARVLPVTRTSIGKKMLMALTGAILLLFALGHMLGNLQIYLGAEAINAYGRALHSVPALLWVVRVVLLFCASVHGIAAIQNYIQSTRARGRYQTPRNYRVATLWSRSMLVSGIVIAAFVVYHLAHLTLGNAHPEFIPGDVHGNLVVGFSDPIASGGYIVAMLFLGMHMIHGVWSTFQTLGLNNSRWTGRLRWLAAGFTAVVVAGNISIPVAVLLGAIC